MVPLYGMDLTKLITVVQGHQELFETVQTMDDVQSSIKGFRGSLEEIRHLTRITTIFLCCIGALMAILMTVVIRLHIRIFQDEKEVCDLVGASPFFYWSPHIVSIFFYIFSSGLLSFSFFFLFRSIFGS